MYQTTEYKDVRKEKNTHEIRNDILIVYDDYIIQKRENNWIAANTL